MRACLRAATAAPSIHNSQPWLFGIDGDDVSVFLDGRRRLPVVDPQGRAMHLSVGAGLLNLRVAILARGRAVQVRLRPDPARPDLAAVVSVGAPAPTDTTVRDLAQAITRRRTSRQPFTRRAVPDPVLAECVQAARDEGALLVPVDPIARYDVFDLLRAAGLRQLADARHADELAAWIATQPDRADGVPVASLGPRAEPPAVPMRDFGPAAPAGVARFEPDPTIAVLYSRSDEPTGWLSAGQALQRVLLTATARGLATSLLTQVVEVPDLRAELAAPGEPSWAQAVIRLGYGRRGPRTPRRPLASVCLPSPAA